MIIIPKHPKNKNELEKDLEDTDAKKYQEIVSSHPTEVIAVTKRENRIEEIENSLKDSKLLKGLEDQALRARTIKAVLKW